MDSMFDQLAAVRRHPDVTDALDLYGRLIGSWDIENRWYDEATAQWRANALEWHFARILDGTGVQDVLRSERGSGTTVRVFDRRAGLWRVGWFGPVAGEFCTLVAHADGDRIHQEGTDKEGRPVRWVFSEVMADAFRWEGHISDDGGRTWRLEQEMRARRR